jgi:hypothetical protein
LLPLTDDCRLILNKPFDEKNVLEESLGTLSRRRSNGGVVKYKIIDIDGAELSINRLLEKYFFSKEYHTSCSVIFTKFHNNSIEQYSMIDDKQAKANSHLKKDITDKKDNANYDPDKDVSIDKSCLYDCYYCDKFVPTYDRDS